MSTDQTFDADTFMNQQVDAPFQDEYRNVPAMEFVARIGDFDSTAFEKYTFTYKKGKRAGEEGSMITFNCPFISDDPKLLEKLPGRESVTVYARCTLDIDDATGQLSTAPDRNVLLGMIKSAVGQNQGGYTFKDLMNTGPVMVKTRHRTDEKDKDRVYVEVSRVTRIS